MTHITKLLQQCTLRVSVSGGHGTGFFVAPQLILTCAHVVKSANPEKIDVFWPYKNQHYIASRENLQLQKHLDLAILKLNFPDLDHPCVNFDLSSPELSDDLFSYGYPQDYPDGDSATFKYEGESTKNNSLLYKLKGGQANYGASGSPLLNQRTGKVCGILNISRNPNMDLGGRAVPVTIIIDQFPELAELNQRFHQNNLKKTGVNPFDYGTPVSPERFYGRKQAILEVKNRIGAISSQSINIVGMRRNGKTSLLRLIRERTEIFFQPQQKPLIVALDLQSPKFHTPKGIIEGLRREILKQIGTEPWKQDVNDDPFEVEDGFIWLRDRGYRLIVILDEFEGIIRHLELFQEWGEDWRAKASAGMLAMVIASKRPLSEDWKTRFPTSSFPNIFSAEFLGALEEKSWHDLVKYGFIQSGESDVVPYQLIYWIDELTGGLPFYVKMAASMFWQYGDYEEARTKFIYQATPRFEELWADLTAAERQIMKNASGKISTQSDAVVDSLKRHGLLRSNGGLFSSAFADFVRNQR
ncbi:MAG TPA: serine protease [Microcoleus sp.]|nr:serine protease [Microcoleus sp.]